MPPPPGYRLRPATAADRRQIELLLRNFDRENQPSGRSWRFWGWSVATGLLLWLMVNLGVAALLLTIVALITGVFWTQINPLGGNDWKQYWVIVCSFDNQPDRVVACAKLCRYRRYSLLFNLLVAPAYRRQGLGSILVESLSQKAIQPLYLACYAHRVSFYTRLGFEPIAAKHLPATVRNELGIVPYSKLLALKLGTDQNQP